MISVLQAGLPRQTASLLRWFGFLLISMLIAQGCGTSLSRQPPPPKPNPTAAAHAALAQRDYPNAARLFQQAAQQQPPGSGQLALQLQAVDAALLAGDVALAESAVAALPATSRHYPTAFQMNLQRAELALMLRQPDTALRHLQLAPDPTLSVELLRRHHKTRAHIESLLGHPLEQVRSLMLADALYRDTEQRTVIQQDILRAIQQFSPTALAAIKPAAPADPLNGWIELAETLRQFSGSELLPGMLAEWRENHPGHPALMEALDLEDIAPTPQTPLTMTPVAAETPDSPLAGSAGFIAVLLPESGRFESPAALIRAGLLAAHAEHPAHAQRELRFYDDSNPQHTLELYQKAVAEGAGWVIGPLTKESLGQISTLDKLPVPVLALNQLDAPKTSGGNLFEFAILPEDEAAMIADYAHAQGFGRALVIHPSGSWGERSLAGFKARLTNLGGTVVETLMYDPAHADDAKLLEPVLINEGRASSGRNAPGARLRGDIQFIFLAAEAGKARLIWPRLQYSLGSSIPVYTTSRIYEGRPDPLNDLDLLGLKFPDMPWMLDPETASLPVKRSQVERSLGKLSGTALRLAALGVDAYGVLSSLPRLQQSPLEAHAGVTGAIHLDENQRLKPRLIWAIMTQNGPQRLTSP